MTNTEILIVNELLTNMSECGAKCADVAHELGIEPQKLVGAICSCVHNTKEKSAYRLRGEIRAEHRKNWKEAHSKKS